jgi:hypothetical protein
MDGNKPRVTEPQPKSSQLGAAVTPDSQPTEGGAEVELGRPEGGRGGRVGWYLKNRSTGGRVAWSSMKHSWGPGLLILGAMVFIEGKTPIVRGVEWLGEDSGAALCPGSPCNLM